MLERAEPPLTLDWSDAAAEAMYRYESRGGEPPGERNGYAVGKRWLEWHVTEWRSGLAEGLTRAEELEGLPERIRRKVFGA